MLDELKECVMHWQFNAKDLQLYAHKTGYYTYYSKIILN
jgi:hypothetical protein